MLTFKDKDVRKAIALQAYDWMWELSQTKDITLDDIFELHKLLYGQINETCAGVYRTQDVIITGSEYPVTHWQNISSEMDALYRWLKTECDSLHPVIYASELHRRFVYIHPFIDGNGRTARLLMNLVLLQEGYEITSIPPVLRSEYISLLERGHKNPAPFNEFIVERVAESQKDMMRLFHIPLKD